MKDHKEPHIPPVNHAAYNRFIQRLGEANAIFQNISDREGVHAAAVAVWKYIEEGNLHQQLANPFTYTAQAMVDLRNGNTHQLFADYPESIERSHSVRKKYLKSFLAAFVEVLRFDGERVGAAETRVAVAANKWDELQGQKITARTIRGWRSEATKPNSDLHDYFNQFVAGFTELDRLERSKQINWYLKNGPPDSACFAR